MTANICGLDYEIVHRDRNSRDDMNMGKCDAKELKIYIDREIPEQQKQAVLVHEWIHAVYDANGIDHSEVQTSVLATELYRSGFRVHTQA